MQAGDSHHQKCEASASTAEAASRHLHRRSAIARPRVRVSRRVRALFISRGKDPKQEI